MKCYITGFEGPPSFGQLERLAGLSEFVVPLLIYINDCFLVSAGGYKYQHFKTRQFRVFLFLTDNLLAFMAIIYAPGKSVCVFLNATSQHTKKIRWHLSLVFKSSALW